MDQDWTKICQESTSYKYLIEFFTCLRAGNISKNKKTVILCEYFKEKCGKNSKYFRSKWGWRGVLYSKRGFSMAGHVMARQVRIFLSNTLYYFLNPNSGELDCACSLFRKHLSMKKGSEVPEFLQFPSKISAHFFMLWN